LKHLNNSQQRNYATGHDNSYAKYYLKKARAQSCRDLPLGSSSITDAVALVDRDMLTRVWDEMDYCIDVCHKTKGGHIEHLSNTLKKNLVSSFVFRCNKMWCPLRSLFTANFLNE
jgi:hypothetical protein